MAKEIYNQPFGTTLIRDGKPTTEFFTLLDQLVSLETQEGEGSPELVLDAPRKTRYWDTLTNDFYFKTTSEGTTNAMGQPIGWILE